MLEINKIYNCDCLEGLKEIDDESINCCITSPPYWALRDYGVDGQLGLEPTFEEYIDKLCNIFDEVKRVLRKDGTCWVVIGDTYGGTGTGQEKSMESKNKQTSGQYEDAIEARNTKNIATKGIYDKCLLMIPFRFAIEMVNRGWILRNTIIWYKPNCMPASVKDRFTVDFEYIFFFVKNKKYWFEQQFEPQQNWGLRDRTEGKYKKAGLANGLTGEINIEGRNKRSVWQVTTKPFKEAHFAVYPPDLIEPMIKAGCPENSIVLDPFFGSGTTGLVAKKLNRNYIGFELNKEYCKIAYNRIKNGK